MGKASPASHVTRLPHSNDPGTLYERDVHKITLLSPEQELELGHRLKDNDPEVRIKARNDLAVSHLPLVIKIVGGKKDYERYNDLIGIGNAALLIAAEKFDYEEGKRFAAYAADCVRKELMKSDLSKHLVKIVTSKPQRKVFSIWRARRPNTTCTEHTSPNPPRKISPRP